MAGGFAAGLFIATDKNRHVLYLAKIESHKKLSTAIIKVAIYGIEADTNEESRRIHKEALEKLGALLASEYLLMPIGFPNKVIDLLLMPHEGYKENTLVPEMLTMLRDDLGLKGLAFMNQAASLTPFLKHKKSTTK